MAELSTEDWDAILEQRRAKSLSKGFLATSKDTNPDKAAEAVKIGKEVGIAPTVIEGNEDSWAKDILANRNKQLISSSPALQRYVEADPMNASVSKDDLGPIDKAQKMAMDFGRVLTPFVMGMAKNPRETISSTAASAGRKLLEFGRDPFGLEEPMLDEIARGEHLRRVKQLMRGDTSVLPAIERYEAEQKLKQQLTTDENRANIFQEVFGQFMGQMVGSVEAGVQGATAGALGGAAATAPAGGVGFIPGAIGGFAAGIIIDQSSLQAASTYRELDLIKGPNGERISEPIKYATAAAVGLTTAAFETFQARLIGKIATTAMKRMLSDKLAHTAFSSMVTYAVAQGVHGGAIEVGQGIAEDLSKQIALIIADVGVDNIANATEKTLIEIGERVGDNFKAGFILSGTLGGVGASLRRGNPVGDSVAVQRAKQSQHRLDMMMEISKDNKTRKRLPEKYAEAIAATELQLPLQIPLSAAENYREQLGWIPGLDDKINEARATGSEIEFNLSDLAAYGNDIYPAIRNDIRIGPMGVTPTEAGAPPPGPMLPPAAPAAMPQAAPAMEAAQQLDLQGDAKTVIQKLFGGRTFPTPEQAAEALAATSAARVMRGIRTPEQAAEMVPVPGVPPVGTSPTAITVRPPAPPIESVIPGAPELPPAPVLSAPKPTPLPVSKETVITSDDYLSADRKTPVDMEAVSRDVVTKVQAALDNGATVTYYVEDTAVPIIGVDRGMMADAKGQRWGVLALMTPSAKRTEVVITPAAVVTPPVSETPVMPTALPAGTAAATVPAAPPKAVDAALKGETRPTGDVPLTDDELIAAIGFGDSAAMNKISETIAQLDPTFLQAIISMDDTGTIAAAVSLKPRNLKELYNAIRQESVARGQDPAEALATIDIAVNNRVAAEMQSAGIAVINGIENEAVRGATLQAARQADDHRAQMWLTPIIDFKATGISKKDYARYSKKIMELQKKITKDLFDFAYKLIKKMETDTWKARANEMLPDVTEAVANRPELTAYEMLMSGKRPFDTTDEPAYAKLNRDEVDAIFTKEELEAAGVKGKVSDFLPKKMFGTAVDSLPIDEATKWFGYQTRKEMLGNLIILQTELNTTKESRQALYKRKVAEELNTRMIAQYGDLAETITRGAMDMAMNVEQLDVVAMELKMLAPDRQLKVEDIQNDIDRTIAQMTVKDASKMEKYQNLAGKYAREAHSALLKGDVVAAFQLKQLEYKQMLMAQAARAIREEVRLTQNIVNRYTHKERRDVRSADLDTRVRQLFELTGLSTGRNAEAQERAVRLSGPTDFKEWRQKYYEDTGYDLPEPQYLSDPNFNPGDLTQMRTADFRGFRKALIAMDRVGRDARFLKGVGEELEVSLFMKHVEENQKWRENAKRYLSSDLDQTTAARLRRQGRHWDAQLLKVESLVDFLDKLDPLGPVNKYMFNMLKESQGTDRKLRVKFASMLNKLNHGENTTTLYQNIENKMWLDETGKPFQLTRNNMLSIALNWGNEGNRKALINGFRSMGHRLDHLAVEDLLMNPNNMSKENWAFVKGIWKVFDELMPEVDAVRYRTMGVPNKRQPNAPFMNGFGETLEGGFYPIMESDGAHNRPHPEEAGLIDPGAYNRLPKTDWLDEKIGNEVPLRLDTAWLVHNMERIIHAVSYTESLMNANKIVNDKDGRFLKTIANAYGSEYADLFPRWLKYIANKGGAYDSQVAAGYDRLVKSLSKNAVSTMVGFNLGTALIHSGSAAVNTYGELGKTAFRATLEVVRDATIMRVVDWMYRNPYNLERAHNQAQELSLEMRARKQTNEADMQAALDRWSQVRFWGKHKMVKYYFNVAAQAVISSTDYASALVGWHGAYTEAMEAGHTAKDAIAMADKLVRSAHGGRNSLLDMSEVQRKENILTWTRFYGYFNHNYNQARKKAFEIERDYSHNRATKNILESTLDMPGMWQRHFWKAFWVMTTYQVLPGLIHAMVRDEIPEDDDPATLAWWTSKALVAQTGALSPIIRDFTFAVQHPAIRSGIPAWNAVGAVQTVTKDILEALDDDELMPKKPIEHFGTAAGFLFGMPSKNFSKGMQLLYDVQSGNREAPDGYEEWVKTMIYGDPKPPGHKKAKKD